MESDSSDDQILSVAPEAAGDRDPLPRLEFSALAFVDDKNGIGLDGRFQSPPTPEAQAIFRKLTFDTSAAHNVVVLGRIAFETFPFPLDGRTVIVLTKHPESLDRIKLNMDENVLVASGLRDAMLFVSLLSGTKNVWVLGGQKVFKGALNNRSLTKIVLVETRREGPRDRVFPLLLSQIWKLTSQKRLLSTDPMSHRTMVYHRRS